MAILTYNEHLLHWAKVTLEHFPMHLEAVERAIQGDLDLISRIDNQSAQTRAVWILVKDRFLSLLLLRQQLESKLHHNNTEKLEAEKRFSVLFHEIMQVWHPEWNPSPPKS